MESQLPDDGLKWFGEGFDGFPKRLPDDCVEYVIHVVRGLNSTAALRTRLNEILKAANEMKRNLLKDYIWQRQDFNLALHPKIDLSTASAKSASKPASHLRGRTDFGDSIADEWLIVYLLTELSKEFLDAWIRVYDTDGEFLLIEAANALPRWLNPEISENRVWINEGHVKIIPTDKGSLPRNLTSEEALSFIKRTPDKLVVDQVIQQEAFHRLREYPSAISSSFHHAFITIPRRLAHLLHRNPAYISPAIEAFYLRDPVSLKPLTTKDTNTLRFPPEDFVTVSIKFTKVGYAQLRSQLFDPPPAWTGIIPRMQDEKVAMGMKLTCGFEMLVTDKQNQNKRTVHEISMLLEDVESGEEELPGDDEIKLWPQVQDDDKWLNIDFKDFEKELDGKAAADGTKRGFGDRGAQENLRKMVSRFEDFLEDDEAGVDGVDDMDEDDDDDAASSSPSPMEEEQQSGPHTPKAKDFAATEEVSDEPEESQTTFNAPEALEDMEFERAIHDTAAMPAWHIEKSGLLDEARRLALEDDADMSGDDVDESEELRKVMELMEQELKGHGALNLEDGTYKKVKSKGPFDDQPADIEEGADLSSDEEDEFNDVDLSLAKNMLEAFKGQAGTSGPAGNLMKALGVQMPRDEEGDD
ncbi:hypothetical protein CERZMDRAFT_112273 [Cercospora zeae-maydis SCOH1-5]|uniref:Uncharacterized protein n=1 Tax=Cercospora zeae-maydis SCOH1-5 TaxID=717836 RepID=A0A6A6FF47_9PEZI|nr:hypothetical protein CERZMDRAFT_112273 [Cercospora zeae-maydis SCOH1-5]